MPARDGVLSVTEAASRLGVTEPRVSQLLKQECTFADPPIFELDSPDGRPEGTTHVADRTISLSSIEAYEARHPWSGSGKRRKRHSATQTARSTSPGPRHRTADESGPLGKSSGIQALRLELEHQLDLNQRLTETLETQAHQATERARALNHRIVDLEADLELKTSTAESFAGSLEGLQSAFNAYGEVFTQDVGPQDSSGA